MNAANIFFVLFGAVLIELQTIFIRDCDGFLLDTNVGKFLRNLTNVDRSTSMARNESLKLSKDTITSAFKGFLKIVDDPMVIKRRGMNYNIPDIVRSEGFVENVSVHYLKNVTLDDVYISNGDTYTELKLTLPSIKLAGWYNMTVFLDRHNMSLYGNGSFVIQLNNLGIRLNLTLEKTAQGFTELNGISWNQTLNGGVFVKLDNLLEDQEVSAVFGENMSVIVPALHDSYKPVIDEFMAQAVVFYGRMLFLNSKHADMETIIHEFANQQTA